MILTSLTPITSVITCTESNIEREVLAVGVESGRVTCSQKTYRMCGSWHMGTMQMLWTSSAMPARAVLPARYQPAWRSAAEKADSWRSMRIPWVLWCTDSSRSANASETEATSYHFHWPQPGWSCYQRCENLVACIDLSISLPIRWYTRSLRRTFFQKYSSLDSKNHRRSNT